MTTMFFAGIPLEGSGSRPLEADLYGSEQQGVDAENISATGNLNIGNVIHYDAHVQRFLSGGAIGGGEHQDNAVSGATDASAGALVPPQAGNSSARTVNYAGDTTNSISNAAPNDNLLQNQQLLAHGINSSATGGAPLSGSNTAGSPSGISSSSTNNTTSSTDSDTTTTFHTPVSRVATNGGTYNEDSFNAYDSHNVTNNYTSNVTTINNVEQHYTQNNYYNDSHNSLISIGDITLIEGGGGSNAGGGTGGGSTTINNFLTNELNIVNTLTTQTINTIIGGGSGGGIDVTSIIHDTLQDITTVLGGGSFHGPQLLTILDTALTQVTTVLGTSGGPGATILATLVQQVGNTLNHVGDVLAGGGALNVPQVLSTVTNLVSDATGGLIGCGAPGTLVAVVGEVGSTLTHMTDSLTNNGAIGGDMTQLVSHALDQVGAILGADTSGTIAATATTTVGDVTTVLDHTIATVGDSSGVALATVVPELGGAVAHTLDVALPVVDPTLSGLTAAPGDIISAVPDVVGLVAQAPAFVDTTVHAALDTVAGVLPAAADLGNIAGALPVVPDVVGLAAHAPSVLDATVHAAADHLGDGLPVLPDIGGLAGNLPAGADLGTLVAQSPTFVADAIPSTVNHAGEGIASLVAPVTDIVSSGLGDHPLIDVNANVLSLPFAAADDHALINTDLSLLAPAADTAPHAAGLGLVDLDASALSAPTTGGSAHDALSLSVHANTVTDIILPDHSIPTVAIDIPLPNIVTSVPLFPTGLEALPVAVLSDLHDTTSGSLLDPMVHLAALTDSTHAIAAVDAGALFAGGSASAGGHADASPASAPAVHIDHLVNLFLGHHA